MEDSRGTLCRNRRQLLLPWNDRAMSAAENTAVGRIMKAAAAAPLASVEA
jgi:hypothetical protein